MRWLLAGFVAYIAVCAFVLSLARAAKAGDAIMDRALRENASPETER